MSFEPENMNPNIILCIFPHLEKILVINSTNIGENIITLNSEMMLDEQFFDSIESKFSKAIRSGNFSILTPNGVPEKVENILRDETIGIIMDMVNQKLSFLKDISHESISIFFFSGQVLGFNKDELLSALNAIYKEKFDNDYLSEIAQTLFKLSTEEKILIEKIKNNELYDLITGQQGEFATIWDKDSIT